ALRGDRPRSGHRLERPARGQPHRARARRGDAAVGAEGDEDRFPGAPMSDEQPTTNGEPELDESAYKVTLPSFHGPLDLLLHLIKQNEVDIYDIPIALVTEQYNAYLEAMEELNLEIAADYIYMAALLIHIKSKMLLPRDEN